HDDVLGHAPDDGEVLLDEQHRALLADALEGAGDLGDEELYESLRRLVHEQDPVLVQERPRYREHLLLPARERAGGLPAALLQLREELVDVREAAGAVAAGGLRALRGPHGPENDPVPPHATRPPPPHSAGRVAPVLPP